MRRMEPRARPQGASRSSAQLRALSPVETIRCCHRRRVAERVPVPLSWSSTALTGGRLGTGWRRVSRWVTHVSAAETATAMRIPHQFHFPVVEDLVDGHTDPDRRGNTAANRRQCARARARARARAACARARARACGSILNAPEPIPAIAPSSPQISPECANVPISIPLARKPGPSAKSGSIQGSLMAGSRLHCVSQAVRPMKVGHVPTRVIAGHCCGGGSLRHRVRQRVV